MYPVSSDTFQLLDRREDALGTFKEKLNITPEILDYNDSDEDLDDMLEEIVDSQDTSED